MPMGNGKIIVQPEQFSLTLDRLCHSIMENHSQFEDSCLVGIQPKGTMLADRLRQRLAHFHPDLHFPIGKLDITFYRDDFRRRDKPLAPNTTEMDFLVENKNVILIDDVLYTGRTVQAALTALQHYGRPRRVELLVMVDRRFNRHLPIQADYLGIKVDAVDEAYVRVEWAETRGRDQVLLFPNKE